tara:strand:- start:1929 stop:2870 length:942 start_codon:yes stop_codon:yes gene_type:complete
MSPLHGGLFCVLEAREKVTMAWIKMRTDLATDPAVIEVSIALGMDEDAVVGKLHKLWSWADTQSRDGHAKGVTYEWLNGYIGVTGFAEALDKAGWMSAEKGGIYIPNFGRHNGQSAKKRAENTERKRVSRERHANSVTEVRPEKIREDKNREDPPSPPPLEAHHSKLAARIEEELSVPMNWRPYETKKLDGLAATHGEDTCLRIVNTAANVITSPRIRNRAAYTVKILEEYDPATEKAADEHEGYVTCDNCKSRHRVLMDLAKRNLYWSAMGKQLAIKCGCGKQVPTGFLVPGTYDVTQLQPLPTPMQEVLHG